MSHSLRSKIFEIALGRTTYHEKKKCYSHLLKLSRNQLDGGHQRLYNCTKVYILDKKFNGCFLEEIKLLFKAHIFTCHNQFFPQENVMSRFNKFLPSEEQLRGRITRIWFTEKKWMCSSYFLLADFGNSDVYPVLC